MKQARKRKRVKSDSWNDLANVWLDNYGSGFGFAKANIYTYSADGMIPWKSYSTCGGCSERKEMSKEDYLCQQCRA